MNKIVRKCILNLSLVIFLFVVLFLIINYISEVSAQENVSLQNQSQICLIDSTIILNELIENNFSYQRVSDNLDKAQSLYDAQNSLSQEGRRVNFSLVIQYCDEIKKIKELAFSAADEYSSLKKFYDISITSEINSSEIDSIMVNIKEEIRTERYENVPALVDSAYNKISEVKASYTALNLFYTSTARGVKNFFVKNGISILITLFVLLFILLIFKKKIRKKLLENKINKLELRREGLRELIKQTQLDYFQYGKMSQGNYSLRTKKFAEFIRDIDRQIPLLKEELAKLIKKTRPNYLSLKKMKRKNERAK